MPFSVIDDLFGLGFAGGSVFFVVPMFSKRPYEVLSLLVSSGFFRLFGRKQNGIAARKLVTPLIKKPSHHAPTQRESCGVIVMLPRIEGNRYKLPKWRIGTFPPYSCKNGYILQCLTFSGNNNYLMRDCSCSEGIRNHTLNAVLFQLPFYMICWLPFCGIHGNTEVHIQHVGKQNEWQAGIKHGVLLGLMIHFYWDQPLLNKIVSVSLKHMDFLCGISKLSHDFKLCIARKMRVVGYILIVVTCWHVWWWTNTVRLSLRDQDWLTVFMLKQSQTLA